MVPITQIGDVTVPMEAINLTVKTMKADDKPRIKRFPVTVSLDRETIRTLDIIAAELQVSRSQLVDHLVREALEAEKGEKE